ncbi:MAG: flagellar protein FlgN [Deltaproteobacteria bacterium]|nr:flagellar protein FlgN [Deltaproteobacteria bacterium]
MGARKQEVGTSDHPYGDIARGCHSVARELLATLQKETAILKGFRTQELMEMLPEKMALVQELGSRMKELQSFAGESGTKQDHPELAALKVTLAEVKKANHLNQLFIQGTLEYWQGLMTLFCPSTYGNPFGPAPHKAALPPRGLTFSKEV